jgi:xylulose-5-phosphate/fructose-6-phosphate phosphoketolase
MLIDRVPQLGYLAAYMKQKVRDQLMAYREYLTTYGQDMPEIRDWKWSEPQGQPNGMGERETRP